MINIFNFFHLNLNYSALSQSKVNDLISNCYLKLFQNIKNCNIQVGIEASGFTIEQIYYRDKRLFNLIINLEDENKIYFIGSGYHQIINPIHNIEINDLNYEMGKEVYIKFFGKNPQTYLINEQVFNKSLLKFYLKKNVKKIIVDDTSNIKGKKQKFETVEKYKENNKEINIIWSQSVVTQITQDYIYDNINLNTFAKSLIKISKTKKNICFYSSDAEAFNFRMKRFDIEKNINNDEYKKLFALKKKLKKFMINWIDFEKAIYIPQRKVDFNFLNFDNPYHVKKQEKYNISRWLNTSEYNIFINSILSKLNTRQIKKMNSKNLLFLASSDLKTHTTKYKINKALKIIKDNDLKLDKVLINEPNLKNNFINLKKIKNKLSKNKKIQVGIFNRMDMLDFNITNDFFSFHTLVNDFITRKKYTDLEERFYKNKKVIVGEYNSKVLSFYKEIYIDTNTIRLNVHFDKNKVIGSIRIPITILIKNNSITLSYKSCHNSLENYLINESNSFLRNKYDFLTVKQLLYSTDGLFKIKANDSMTISQDINFSNYPIAIETFSHDKLNNLKLIRLIISIQELDDTTTAPSLLPDLKIKITLN